MIQTDSVVTNFGRVFYYQNQNSLDTLIYHDYLDSITLQKSLPKLGKFTTDGSISFALEICVLTAENCMVKIVKN